MRYKAINWGMANCRGTDPEAWFLDSNGNGGAVSSLVERTCRACDIQPACLQWALDNGEYGYWGGQYFTDHRGDDDGEFRQVQSGSDGDNVSNVQPGTAPAV